MQEFHITNLNISYVKLTIKCAGKGLKLGTY